MAAATALLAMPCSPAQYSRNSCTVNSLYSGGVSGKVAQAQFGGFRLIQQIETVDFNLPGAGCEIAAQHLHGSGFARAVGAQKTEYFAFG